MTKSLKIRMYLKTADIEWSRFSWCIKNDHFGKPADKDGFCNYCDGCFFMFKKLMEAINTLEKTHQIVVSRRMRTTFIIDAN